MPTCVALSRVEDDLEHGWWSCVGPVVAHAVGVRPHPGGVEEDGGTQGIEDQLGVPGRQLAVELKSDVLDEVRRRPVTLELLQRCQQGDEGEECRGTASGQTRG
jgi:hypothetical protein